MMLPILEPTSPAAQPPARDLGIDYVFIGPAEQKANSAAALSKFAMREDLFRDNALFVSGAIGLSISGLPVRL